MGELKVGDEVLARDAGVDVFTRVEGWLHRETQGYSPYLNIHYHDGALSVSRKHNIAVDEHDYHFAEDLLGKSLFGLTLTVT